MQSLSLPCMNNTTCDVRNWMSQAGGTQKQKDLDLGHNIKLKAKITMLNENSLILHSQPVGMGKRMIQPTIDNFNTSTFHSSEKGMPQTRQQNSR